MDGDGVNVWAGFGGEMTRPNGKGTGIKKPACGRLLADCFSLFLTNLSSLQIAQPTLRRAE